MGEICEIFTDYKSLKYLFYSKGVKCEAMEMARID